MDIFAYLKTHLGCTFTKIGTIQSVVTGPLRKDGT